MLIMFSNTTVMVKGDIYFIFTFTNKII